MIISVASGKGGTGKTTVSTNMAMSLNGNVQILDCDVEEPNAHLFLQPEISETIPYNTPVPVVDDDKCTYCKECSKICRFSAITVVASSVLVFPENCHSCGGCMAVCPEDAITEGPRQLGVIEKGSRGALGFVHGKLNIGEAMAPPLIREVRKAEDNEMISIIDAPPGTSCPVITAMKGADFVVMVTEPTPFGLHDLKLAVAAVKTLNIPHGIVINRADVGDHKVHHYAAEMNIPILMEIPFDRKIAELYSRGELIVEAMPEWKEKFKQLYQTIEALVVNK